MLRFLTEFRAPLGALVHIDRLCCDYSKADGHACELVQIESDDSDEVTRRAEVSRQPIAGYEWHGKILYLLSFCFHYKRVSLLFSFSS